MTSTTVTLSYKGIEFDVDVHGDVTTGGSNAHGSDEPPWIEVDGVLYTHNWSGIRVSKRVHDMIERNFYDYTRQALAEVHQAC